MAYEKDSHEAAAADDDSSRQQSTHNNRPLPLSRSGTVDSSASREDPKDQALLSRNLPGLRNKSPTRTVTGRLGRSISNESSNQITGSSGHSTTGSFAYDMDNITMPDTDDTTMTNSTRSLQQTPDDKNKAGSVRSLMTEESGLSNSNSTGGDVAASAAHSPVQAPKPVSLRGQCAGPALPGTATPAAAAVAAPTTPTTPRPRRLSHTRGLSRRGKMNLQGSSTTLLSPSSKGISLTGLSEHSSITAAAANAAVLERIAFHRGLSRGAGRMRGLGTKKLSAQMVIEPGLSPMVASKGSLSPLPGKLLAKANSRGSMPSDMLAQGLDACNLLESDDDDEEEMGQRRLYQSNRMKIPALSTHTSSTPASTELKNGGPSPRQVGSNNTTSSTYINNGGPPLQRLDSNNTSTTDLNRPGLRGRRESSRMMMAASQHSSSIASMAGASTTSTQQSPSATTMATAATAPAPEVPPPAHAAAAAGEGAELYQPTQQDWAALYKRHVEELERKDLEIAMKLSARPTGVYDNTVGNNEDDVDEEADDAASLDGIELALEVSKREVCQTNPDEEEVLQMVLEMSKNDSGFDSSFDVSFDASFGLNNDNNDSNSNNIGDNYSMRNQALENCEGHINASSCTTGFLSERTDGDNEDDDLKRAFQLSCRQSLKLPVFSEEEELERVLRMSAESPPPPARATIRDEDEELQRILQLSQQHHEEEELHKQNSKESDQQEDEDAELLRVLQMSQKEATDQEKERNVMELVLQLSRQETTDIVDRWRS